MSRNTARRLLAEQLGAAAAGYQRAVVIPHCAVCARPCCRLDPLVLELDWRQLKALWQIDGSRAAFDRRLSAGQGPVEIRAGHGLYYAHRTSCPAYDAARHACRVYDRSIKPQGCKDFPVYPDGADIVADLRCEAVDIEALTKWIADAAGPAFSIDRRADAEFPFLVALSPRRANNAVFAPCSGSAI